MDKVFREFIEITVNDPHVSSFVQLSESTEASDSLQGQSLCAAFMNGLTTMEEISSHLLYVLESPRSQFPRLYYLSDGEVIKLLSLQLPAPSSLLPMVQKCFKGVKQLDVQVEDDVCSENYLSALSNEQMWVHGVHGEFGEHVPFVCPLESNLCPVAWLNLFEQKLYQAVKQTFLKCLAVHQNSMLEKLPGTPDLIGNSKGNSSEVTHESPSLLKLISQFPLQCLLVAEEVLWCSMVQKSSHCTTTGMWMRIKSQSAAKLHYLCQLIKEHAANSNEKPSQRTLTALRALVMMIMKHSGQTDGLVEVKGDLESSFEWHKLMKYYIIPNADATTSDLLPSQEDQTVCVDILSTQLPYGYEYIGPKNWTMVTTPSTEQAYMGIILALSSFKCAFISGPHMSGKQHAAVQLGYALGRQVVILKCCLSTGSSVVSQMLLGAFQTGAWLVLDSVELLGQGTLSELGQHLTEIHQHLSAVQRQAQKEGHELSSTDGKCSSGEFIKKYNSTVNEVECHIAGKNIWAKLTYGCITISDNGYSTEIPENLRAAMRPVAMMQPHYRIIAEAMLVSFGFSEAATISRRLDSLFSLAKDSHCLPDFVSGYQTSWLVLLKNVIVASGTHLHLSRHLEETDTCTFSSQNETGSANTNLETMPEKVKFVNQSNAIKNAKLEEQAAIKGVLSVMRYTVSDPKRASQFHILFEEIFPKVRYFPSLQQFIDQEEQSMLRNVVEDESQQQGFYPDTQMLQNVLILHQALKLSNVVVLVGPAGSGKTILYQALVSALKKLSRDLEVESACHPNGDLKDIYRHLSMSCWGSVSTEVIFPNTLSHKQFFGGYFGIDNSWSDGAFTKALRHSEQPLPIDPFKRKKTVQMQQVKWIVLDGDPFGRPAWMDSLITLCDLEHPHLYLSSGEKIEPSRLKILAEVTNLGDSTPSVVTHCSLVYVSGENMWRSVWKCQMDVLSREHNVDQVTLEMWSHLAKDLFPDTLVFLKNKALSSVLASDGREGRHSSRITDGLQEIMSFIKILHALLVHSGKAEDLKYTSRKTETTGRIPLNSISSVVQIYAFMADFSALGT